MKFQERTLWQNIKSGELYPVYLIKGNEGYLKQKYANLLADSVVPAGLEAFNFHKLKGEDTSPEEIIDCVLALPAMCERTCVFVHDYDFDGAGETEKSQLLELFSDLPDTCVLIFWQDTKGFSTKTKASKELLELIDKNGAVCTLDKRDANELAKFAVSECGKHECNISYGAAAYLVNCVGDDMANLVNEIEKLCSYKKGTITEAEIDAVCIKSVEATAFQMVDAMLANNFDKAFRDLKVLFEQKTEPTMLLGALTSSYVDMYRAKLAETTGHSLKEVARLFPGTYKNDFRLKNALGRTRKFSMRSLENSLEVLAKADLKLKTSFDDNQVVFEKLIIELAKARKSS